MSHHHITPSQRNEIAVLLRTGSTQKEIARIIGTTPSAISQELKRNSDAYGVYRAGLSHSLNISICFVIRLWLEYSMGFERGTALLRREVLRISVYAKS